MTAAPITPSEVAEVQRLAEKATPGPWKAASGGIEGDEPDRQVVLSERDYYVATIENGAPGDTMKTEEATAAFIANARTSLPAALAWREKALPLLREAIDLASTHAMQTGGDKLGTARKYVEKITALLGAEEA